MGKKKVVDADELRSVHAGHPDRNAGFVDNTVRNTKYTLWDFLPKNLAEQFGYGDDYYIYIYIISRRFMNQYFLLIACLQLFPTISPVEPITTWGPLIFILAVTAVKEVRMF